MKENFLKRHEETIITAVVIMGIIAYVCLIILAAFMGYEFPDTNLY